VTDAVTSGPFELRPPSVAPASEAHQPAELFSIEAVRDGNRVVQLRGLEVESGYAVEVRVEAVDGRAVEPRATRSHPFARQADAKAFVDEAAAALQYLGCHIRTQGV
jgi:hypothetical protein